MGVALRLVGRSSHQGPLGVGVGATVRATATATLLSAVGADGPHLATANISVALCASATLTSVALTTPLASSLVLNAASKGLDIQGAVSITKKGQDWVGMDMGRVRNLQTE